MYNVLFTNGQWSVYDAQGTVRGSFATQAEADLHKLMLQGVAQSRQGSVNVRQESGQWVVYDASGRVFGRFATQQEANDHVNSLFGMAPPPPPTATAPPVPPPSMPQGAGPGGWPAGMGGPPPVGQPFAPPPITPPSAFPLGMVPPAYTPPLPPQFPQSAAAAYQQVAAQQFPAGMGWAPPPRPAPTRMQRFNRMFRQAAPAAAAFGGVRGAAFAGRAAAVAAAPEVAIPIMIGVAIAKEAQNAARALYEFTERTLDANKSLAAFSPLMATSFAQFGMHELGRQRGLAGATEITGAELIRSMDRLRDSFYPFEVFSRNITNQAASFTAGGIGAAAQDFQPVIDILEGIRANTKVSAEDFGRTIVDLIMSSSPFGALLDVIGGIRDWLVDNGWIILNKPGLPAGAWDQLMANRNRIGFPGPNPAAPPPFDPFRRP